MNKNFSTGKFLDKLSLSYTCKQVILGSLLGKGFLEAKNIDEEKVVYFCFYHRTGLREYGAWKSHFLSEIGYDDSLKIHKTVGYGVGNKITYKSNSDDRLTDLYNYLYTDGHLHVLRRWLNYLDSLALLIWWFDVGCIIDSGRRGVFRTDDLPLTAIKIIKRFLRVKFSIETSIIRHGTTTSFRGAYIYRLYMTSESFRNFLRLISKSMVASPRGLFLPMMLFKFKLLYKYKNMQQRWISELQELMPQYKNEIIRLYEPQKSMCMADFELDVLKFRPGSESDLYAIIDSFKSF